MAQPWWLKQLRLCGGFLALAAGVVLSIPLVPGPGIPLILFGLLLLSDHFVWATGGSRVGQAQMAESCGSVDGPLVA